jgi:hypothetical protein
VTADYRTDRPSVVHHLAAAIRFLEVFSGEEISAPLEVEAPSLPVVVGMPQLPWRAVRERNVYRFQVSNREVMPSGSIAVTVACPAGDFANFEAINLSLPPVLSVPFPVASDFLLERPLWPTRKFALRAGETAMIVSLRSGGATDVRGIRIKAKRSGALPPDPPATYTDEDGETVVRLMGDAFRRIPGTTSVPVDFDLRLPPLFAAPAAVLAPALPLTIDLGTITTVFLDLP